MWASINQGRTVFPDIFRTSVSGPMRESQAVLSPIAINLPSDIANELAFGVRGSIVIILAFFITVCACLPDCVI